MKFTYQILGRTPGFPKPTFYAGEVDASVPKEAIIKALAMEFGAPSRSNANDALVQSQWTDVETLAPQIALLKDDDMNFCLHTGEHTFDVEVMIVPDDIK